MLSFKDFLTNTGWFSVSSVNSTDSAISTSIPQKLGFYPNEIDEIVDDDMKMKSVLIAVADAFPDRPTERQNNIKLYYYYKNNDWYDDWRPRNFRKTPSLKPHDDDVEEKLNGYRTSASVAPFTDSLRKISESHAINSYTDNVQPVRPACNWDVRYEQDVEPDTYINGLVDFIHLEIDNIIPYICEMTELDRSLLHGVVLLSKKRIKKTYSKSFSKNEIEAFCRKHQYDEPFPVDWLLKLFDGMSFSECIVGDYNGCHNVPIIHIYYRTINALSGNAEYYLAGIRKVLSHELMHAAHHIKAPNTFHEASVPAERVREALADFFSVKYCLNTRTCIWGDLIAANSMKIAISRFEKWRERYNTIWPYAYALYFLNGIMASDMPYPSNTNMDNCNGRFSEVLTSSIRNMWESYRILITFGSHNPSVIPNGISKLSYVNSSAGNNHTKEDNSQTMQFITQHFAKEKDMTEDEIANYYYPDNINSKESLAPIYIMNILEENRERYMKSSVIGKLLRIDYGIELTRNPMTRILNTLAMYSPVVHRRKNGSYFEYWYSETIPQDLDYNNPDPYDNKDYHKKHSDAEE